MFYGWCFLIVFDFFLIVSQFGIYWVRMIPSVPSSSHCIKLTNECLIKLKLVIASASKQTRVFGVSICCLVPYKIIMSYLMSFTPNKDASFQLKVH